MRQLNAVFLLGSILVTLLVGCSNGEVERVFRHTKAPKRSNALVSESAGSLTHTNSAGASPSSCWPSSPGTRVVDNPGNQLYLINPSGATTFDHTGPAASVRITGTLVGFDPGACVTITLINNGSSDFRSISARYDLQPVAGSNSVVAADGNSFDGVVQLPEGSYTAVVSAITNFGQGSTYYKNAVVGARSSCWPNSAEGAVLVDNPGNLVKVTSPAALQVFQRAGDNGLVRVSGSLVGYDPGACVTVTLQDYSGPNAVNRYASYDLQPLPGKSRVVAADGKSFDGLVQLPAGQFTLVVSAITNFGKGGTFYKNPISDASRINQVGVGEVFLVAGQSNSTQCGYPWAAAGRDGGTLLPAVPMPIGIHGTGVVEKNLYSSRGASDGAIYTPVNLSKITAASVAATYGSGEVMYRPGIAPFVGVQDSCTGGNPWSYLGDMIVFTTNVPVMFASVGRSATGINDWLPPNTSAKIGAPTIYAPGAGTNITRGVVLWGSWKGQVGNVLWNFTNGTQYTSGYLYQKLKDSAIALMGASCGGLQNCAGFRSVLWQQGENDAAYTGELSAQTPSVGGCLPGATCDQASYQAKLLTVISSLRADAGFPNMPWLVARVNNPLQLPYYTTANNAGAGGATVFGCEGTDLSGSNWCTRNKPGSVGYVPPSTAAQIAVTQPAANMGPNAFIYPGADTTVLVDNILYGITPIAGKTLQEAANLNERIYQFEGGCTDYQGNRGFPCRDYSASALSGMQGGASNWCQDLQTNACRFSATNGSNAIHLSKWGLYDLAYAWHVALQAAFGKTL